MENFTAEQNFRFSQEMDTIDAYTEELFGMDEVLLKEAGPNGEKPDAL